MRSRRKGRTLSLSKFSCCIRKNRPNSSVRGVYVSAEITTTGCDDTCRTTGVSPAGAYVRRTVGRSRNLLSSINASVRSSRSAFLKVGCAFGPEVFDFLFVALPSATLRFLVSPVEFLEIAIG